MSHSCSMTFKEVKECTAVDSLYVGLQQELYE